MLPLLVALASPPSVSIDRDDVVVRESCTIRVAAPEVRDADGDGVLHIRGRDDGERIVVDLGGATLSGGAEAPESRTGTGIAITGRNVTLRNGAIRGFRIGIRAEDCDGLVLEDLDASDNYAQRLRSTPWAEDASDWLYPHRNDGGEWLRDHGAAIAVRNASGATLRRNTVRRTQNGIVLDRVTRSEISDNDCSFLSGWGVAMWRSTENTVCRNSLDFCVRGYSHGVYNRGQDSAGLLMFEQCSRNTVALNSITHGGDGVFGFAGREALGDAGDRGDAFHAGRGCNDNLFIDNDLSYAAAHGLEMTFGFRNTIVRNRFEWNAICGIWAGYARDTAVRANRFVANGGAGYGSERGGINMEHGQRARIEGNSFSREPIGVFIWDDEDAGIARTPWARANGMRPEGNVVRENSFDACRATADIAGAAESNETAAPTDAELDAILAALPGARVAIGARKDLRGRDRIIMLEHGPYAWDRPILRAVPTAAGGMAFRAHGLGALASAEALGADGVVASVRADGATVELVSRDIGVVAPATVVVRDVHGASLRADALVATLRWKTRFFALDSAQGRLAEVPDPQAFRALALSGGIDRDLPALELPSTERPAGTDRYGLVAESRVRFAPGTYRLEVLSDDGVRVLVDGQTVIDRWDIHGTERDIHRFRIDDERVLRFRVEYFQNRGGARLSVRLASDG